MVSSVREEEDQGDCGGSPGPGQGAVMSHAGQSSFGGGWGGLRWDGEVRGWRDELRGALSRRLMSEERREGLGLGIAFLRLEQLENDLLLTVLSRGEKRSHLSFKKGHLQQCGCWAIGWWVFGSKETGKGLA